MKEQDIVILLKKLTSKGRNLSVRKLAEELNMNVTTCALNGGEDYELLFTLPIGDYAKISEMEDVKLIGHITKESLGRILVTRDDNEFELKAQGWNPLKGE